MNKTILESLPKQIKIFGENYLLKDVAQDLLESAIKNSDRQSFVSWQVSLFEKTSDSDILSKLYHDLALHDVFYEEILKGFNVIDKLCTPLPSNSSVFDQKLSERFHEKIASMSFQEINKRAEIADQAYTKYLKDTGQYLEKEKDMLDNFKFEMTLEEDQLDLLPQVLLLNQKINNADSSYYYIKPSSKDRVVISRCHMEANHIQEKYPLDVLLPLVVFKLKQLEAIPDPYRSGDGSSYPAFLIKETYHGIEMKRDYVYAGK